MDYEEDFIKKCEKLGENIKKFRVFKNKSLKQMSENTGISVRYLRKIESGKAFGVLIDRHLLKRSEFLNIKLSELFDFE